MNAEVENERSDLPVLHSERITISDGRYLIFYTFDGATDAQHPAKQGEEEEK